MTFSEYINQTDPKRQFSVTVTKDDCFHIYNVHNGTIIVLFMLDDYFSYLLPNDRMSYSNRLYTMDSDGNKKSSSCFVFN